MRKEIEIPKKENTRSGNTLLEPFSGFCLSLLLTFNCGVLILLERERLLFHPLVPLQVRLHLRVLFRIPMITAS